MGSAAAAAATQTASGQRRSVYVTVIDDAGQPVRDLEADDFTVRTGGRGREVVEARPLTGRIRLFLMVEEAITADSFVRIGLIEFMQRTAPLADITLLTIGLRNTTVAESSSDINVLAAAVKNLPARRNVEAQNVVEGIHDVARTVRRQPGRRTAIVAIALETNQESTELPDRVIDQIRVSGAVLHAVTIPTAPRTSGVGALGDLSARSHVLGDGTRQSGGRRIEVLRTPGIPRALQQIADDLSAQYMITYVLPAGTRPSSSIEIEARRRDVTLRAPTRIDERNEGN